MAELDRASSTGERRGSGGWDSVLETEAYDVSPGGEWRSELWWVAVTQFNQASNLLKLDADARARLLEPRRAIVVNFPIRRDSGGGSLAASPVSWCL